MIIELSEMMDRMESFMENSSLSNCFVAGGMVGSPLLQYAIQAACHDEDDIYQILIIEGCQDNAILNTNQKLHIVFWGDICYDEMYDKLNIADEFGMARDGLHTTFNRITDTVIRVHPEYLCSFKTLIIHNAHLIPTAIMDEIAGLFNGKVFILADPFEIGGEHFMGCQTITDTMSKLPRHISFARSFYDVDTRYVNLKSKSSFNSLSNIHFRNIGKISDRCQYVTNSEDLASFVWERQRKMPFNKGHKLWLLTNTINHYHYLKRYNDFPFTLTKNALLTVTNVHKKQNLVTVKPNMCDACLTMEACYDRVFDRAITMHVRPANILLLDEIRYHYYSHIVYVQQKQQNHNVRRINYTLLKHCNALTYVENVK